MANTPPIMSRHGHAFVAELQALCTRYKLQLYVPMAGELELWQLPPTGASLDLVRVVDCLGGMLPAGPPVDTPQES